MPLELNTTEPSEQDKKGRWNEIMAYLWYKHLENNYADSSSDLYLETALIHHQAAKKEGYVVAVSESLARRLNLPAPQPSKFIDEGPTQFAGQDKVYTQKH